jgi:hypothetical protein
MAAISSKLFVSHISDPVQLVSVYEELNGWQKLSNQRENALDRTDENEAIHAGISNYYPIAQSAKNVVMATMGMCDPTANKKFNGYKVLAAVDESGNLQGVCLVDFLEGKKGIGAKVHILVTNFWNTPFCGEENKNKVRGAGTALIAKTVEMAAGTGAVFLEPTKESEAFYKKRTFAVIPGWVPKTMGSSCGMQLPKTAHQTYLATHASLYQSKNESELPPIKEHYMKFLGEKMKADLLEEAKRIKEES